MTWPQAASRPAEFSSQRRQTGHCTSRLPAIPAFVHRTTTEQNHGLASVSVLPCQFNNDLRVKVCLRCPPFRASESTIAIIYLQWVVFGMIFEELNPARHWLVLPVGIKGRSPKSIAGKIEQSDMSFRPINGFVSYSVLKKDIVFCPKCSGFGIPVQQNSLDNFLRVPIKRKLTGNKVLVFAMLGIQICFFDDKSFLNPRII